MRNLIKITGSSLLSAMIFGFVILVTVSSLIYVVRYNLLSIKSLANQEAISTFEQQYIQSITKKDHIKAGKSNLGNYVIENTLQSRQPIFSHKNIDISLYHGEPTAISSDIIHKLFYKDNLKITKQIFYKSLPRGSMINYDSAFVPINIPYVNVDRMNNLQKHYHLNKQGDIGDKSKGYIGFIEKQYNWFVISVNNNVQVISLKKMQLSDDYQINIGWDLHKGNWQMLIAIYDNKHLYIYKTKLDDLTNHFDKAVLDLSTPFKIVDGPVGIAAVSWEYLKDNVEPSLAVLSIRYGEDGDAGAIVGDIEFDKTKDAYITSIRDIINNLGEIKKSNVYVIALDPFFTLASSSLYVFVGDRLVVYKFDSAYKIKKNTVILGDVIKNPPVIAKKDSYSNYLLIYDKNSYYQYIYTRDSNVFNALKPVIYPEQNIQNIIVKYGLKYIVTKKDIYIDDFQNNQLKSISI